MGEEIDIELKEPDFVEKSRFKDSRLHLLRASDGDEGAVGKARLGNGQDLRIDEGVVGALTEVGRGMGEVLIDCGRNSKGG